MGCCYGTEHPQPLDDVNPGKESTTSKLGMKMRHTFLFPVTGIVDNYRKDMHENLLKSDMSPGHSGSSWVPDDEMEGNGIVDNYRKDMDENLLKSDMGPGHSGSSWVPDDEMEGNGIVQSGPRLPFQAEKMVAAETQKDDYSLPPTNLTDSSSKYQETPSSELPGSSRLHSKMETMQDRSSTETSETRKSAASLLEVKSSNKFLRRNARATQTSQSSILAVTDTKIEGESEQSSDKAAGKEPSLHIIKVENGVNLEDVTGKNDIELENSDVGDTKEPTVKQNDIDNSDRSLPTKSKMQSIEKSDLSLIDLDKKKDSNNSIESAAADLCIPIRENQIQTQEKSDLPLIDLDKKKISNSIESRRGDLAIPMWEKQIQTRGKSDLSLIDLDKKKISKNSIVESRRGDLSIPMWEKQIQTQRSDFSRSSTEQEIRKKAAQRLSGSTDLSLPMKEAAVQTRRSDLALPDHERIYVKRKERLPGMTDLAMPMREQGIQTRQSDKALSVNVPMKGKRKQMLEGTTDLAVPMRERGNQNRTSDKAVPFQESMKRKRKQKMEGATDLAIPMREKGIQTHPNDMALSVKDPIKGKRKQRMEGATDLAIPMREKGIQTHPNDMALSVKDPTKGKRKERLAGTTDLALPMRERGIQTQPNDMALSVKDPTKGKRRERLAGTTDLAIPIKGTFHPHQSDLALSVTGTGNVQPKRTRGSGRTDLALPTKEKARAAQNNLSLSVLGPAQAKGKVKIYGRTDIALPTKEKARACQNTMSLSIINANTRRVPAKVKLSGTTDLSFPVRMNDKRKRNDLSLIFLVQDGSRNVSAVPRDVNRATEENKTNRKPSDAPSKIPETKNLSPLAEEAQKPETPSCVVNSVQALKRLCLKSEINYNFPKNIEFRVKREATRNSIPNDSNEFSKKQRKKNCAPKQNATSYTRRQAKEEHSNDYPCNCVDDISKCI